MAAVLVRTTDDTCPSLIDTASVSVLDMPKPVLCSPDAVTITLIRDAPLPTPRPFAPDPILPLTDESDIHIDASHPVRCVRARVDDDCTPLTPTIVMLWLPVMPAAFVRTTELTVLLPSIVTLRVMVDTAMPTVTTTPLALRVVVASPPLRLAVLAAKEESDNHTLAADAEPPPIRTPRVVLPLVLPAPAPTMVTDVLPVDGSFAAIALLLNTWLSIDSPRVSVADAIAMPDAPPVTTTRLPCRAA